MVVRRALALLIVVLSVLATLPAAAQEVHRTVILKVAGGGTELLTAEIKALPNVDVRDQAWFLEQVKARGMTPKKLLQRPADLRFVMSGSNIAYVVYVDHDDGQYIGRIFAADGRPADKINLGSDFGQVEAAEVRSLFERVLGIEVEAVEPIDLTPTEKAAPKAAVAEADVATTKKPIGDARRGLTIGAAARVFKRDLSYAGSNNAVLNYRSGLYPGAALDAEYVLGTQVGPSLLALWLGAEAGLDSLAVDASTTSILHLDAAGGVGVNFDRLKLRLGARHVRYSLSANDVFPTIVHTLVLVGLAAEESLGAMTLGADVELHPWGTYHGSSARLFGASSIQQGFSAGVRMGYPVGSSFAFAVGYRARLERSSFPGQGSLDFSDSHGFELVHGPELGVTWHP